METPAPETVPGRRSPWAGLVYPTDQHALLDMHAAGVFQPTAAGHLESAWYGSVRTRMSEGGRLRPSFHEGVDIAPQQRDRKGQPLDEVRAVADGIVAYVNRVSGRSNYGLYVVLLHEDPMGRVYTLYAHLRRLAPNLLPGRPVVAGDVLGTMGWTSSSPIPVARSHLHFEIGLLLNGHFESWYRARRYKPDHGLFHGWNLLGVDPLAFLRFQREQPGASLADFLDRVPVAFEVLLAAHGKPDYFGRYPGRWIGPPPAGAIVVSCSENGVPLGGRAATDAEREQLGRQKSKILNVQKEVLGRNGARLVTCRGGEWVLAEAGEQWREILLYPVGP